ncbi:uncharacterized protein TNIN_146871 [Trichonephila inaurata madagascariensis]|uniref:Monocarboxylate transporter 9 n=1 Tax=Trichonephila inaurata madagascariensis TaxID=2747483 RepID=A0A8X6XE50_9ARAC|nr:uncharacterized protein TNIN_146871 [Trichonephila inaurata madagascariensis]
MEGPDRGWAWAVVFAACLINLIVNGQGRMSGILYVAFIDLFGIDRKGASTPMSVRTSTRNLLAIGAALTMVQIQVVIGQYFKKYRTTAGGMVFSGACAGSFLFPPLVEWLIKDYGIEGTFLILSGIVMHSIPATMILKKPSWLIKRPASQKGKDSSIKDGDGTEGISGKIPDVECLRRNSNLVLKLLNINYGKEGLNVVSLEANERDSITSEEKCISDILESIYGSFQLSSTNEKYENLAFSRDSDMDTIHSEDIPKTQRNQFEQASKSNSIERSNGNWDNISSMHDVWSISKEDSEHNVLLKLKTLLDMDSKNIAPLFQNESSVDILKILTELQKLYNWLLRKSKNSDYQERKKTKKNTEESNSFPDHIKRTIRLFRDPAYWVICLSRCIHFLIFVPFLTIIVDFTIDRGFPESEGSYVIAAVSFGDLIGRLCLGWVTDRGYLSLSQYMLVGLLAQGLNTASLPLMPTKAAVYTSLFIFGMVQGSLFVRHPVLVQKYMGRNVQSIAMGCMNFFPGLLGFTFPIYIGYFRDILGTYDPIFYINGVAAVLVALLWALEPYLQRCRKET